MIFTEAQRIIIRTVCSYHFKTLENLLLQPDLEEDYILILEQHGATRKHYDEALKEIKVSFESVWNDPDTLLEIPELELYVFSFVLNRIAGDFRELYPKAFNNLLNNILIHQLVKSQE